MPMSDRRQPTMRDVAGRAHVSLSTVSRVVNGDPAVAPALAQRVRATIAELDYRRDLTASSLRRADRATTSIGLVFDDLANPFFAAVQRGVEEVARMRGVLALAGSTDDQVQRERELVEAFLARRVDGIVVAPVSSDQSHLAREASTGAPVVFVDRPPEGLDADVVTIDNVAAARSGVEHLIASGHRRIAFIGSRRHISSSRDRLLGYRTALELANVPFDESLVRLDVHGATVAAAEVDALLDRDEPPTALFTAQNQITTGAVLALRRRNASRRIAVVGFDDLELASALDPPLTVVSQDPLALGRTAAELLFARIDGDDGPTRRVIEPTHLIARGSGEIRPAGL
jgi:LacI family transcriptional regulator